MVRSIISPSIPSIRGLTSFGEVAAEDDSVLEYFLRTDALRRIQENNITLVLGRKGSGKTALVRYFAESAGIGESKPWLTDKTRLYRSDLAGCSPSL